MAGQTGRPVKQAEAFMASVESGEVSLGPLELVLPAPHQEVGEVVETHVLGREVVRVEVELVGVDSK
jgi:hypothetical protein